MPTRIGNRDIWVGANNQSEYRELAHEERRISGRLAAGTATRDEVETYNDRVNKFADKYPPAPNRSDQPAYIDVKPGFRMDPPAPSIEESRQRTAELASLGVDVTKFVRLPTSNDGTVYLSTKPNGCDPKRVAAVSLDGGLHTIGWDGSFVGSTGPREEVGMRVRFPFVQDRRPEVKIEFVDGRTVSFKLSEDDSKPVNEAIDELRYGVGDPYVPSVDGGFVQIDYAPGVLDGLSENSTRDELLGALPQLASLDKYASIVTPRPAPSCQG